LHGCPWPDVTPSLQRLLSRIARLLYSVPQGKVINLPFKQTGQTMSQEETVWIKASIGRRP